MTLQKTDSTSAVAWNLLLICWFIAACATLGSLFMSEVMGFEPCVLCWFQRIFIYPLTIILLIALFPLDTNVVRYALPLAIIGWAFAVYHYLLYSGFIPESLQPCSETGPSCSDVNLELFGFITIPMMSILAYSVIIGLLLIVKFRK